MLCLIKLNFHIIRLEFCEFSRRCSQKHISSQFKTEWSTKSHAHMRATYIAYRVRYFSIAAWMLQRNVRLSVLYSYFSRSVVQHGNFFAIVFIIANHCPRCFTEFSRCCLASKLTTCNQMLVVEKKDRLFLIRANGNNGTLFLPRGLQKYIYKTRKSINNRVDKWRAKFKEENELLYSHD
jgi:hypothetical protein